MGQISEELGSTITLSKMDMTSVRTWLCDQFLNSEAFPFLITLHLALTPG